jgi:hypothetical protein
MARNFYFGKDADIVAGSANFSTLITASPTTYNLVAAQATAFAALNTALQSAYTASINPETRTPVTVGAKRIAAANMRANAVLLSKIIYSTATVNDSQLTALGLLPRASRTPVPAPGNPPGIDIVSSTGNTVKIRLHDSTSSSRRGKPLGVSGASVFSFVGAVAPTDQAGWNFEGNTSRTVVDVTFPSGTAAGAKVWFTAFWFNPRKQSGPAAAAVGTNIPGGAAMAA